jgi:hypothetical protein
MRPARHASHRELESFRTTVLRSPYSRRERQAVERVTQERGLRKARTQVSDDREILVGQLRHCTVLHPGLSDCRGEDLKSADSPTRGRCQTAGVKKKINLGRRKAAVWSKLLSFEKKF